MLINKSTIIAAIATLVFGIAIVGLDKQFGWGMTFWHRFPLNMAFYFAVAYTFSFLDNKDEGAH